MTIKERPATEENYFKQYIYQLTSFQRLVKVGRMRDKCKENVGDRQLHPKQK